MGQITCQVINEWKPLIITFIYLIFFTKCHHVVQHIHTVTSSLLPCTYTCMHSCLRKCSVPSDQKIYHIVPLFPLQDPQVDCYRTSRVQTELHLSRENLVGLAIFLGCDYIPKVRRAPWSEICASKSLIWVIYRMLTVHCLSSTRAYLVLVKSKPWGSFRWLKDKHCCRGRKHTHTVDHLSCILIADEHFFFFSVLCLCTCNRLLIASDSSSGRRRMQVCLRES